MKRIGLFAVVVGLSLSGVDASAETLYGTDRTSNLFTIDPTTGATTIIGPLGIATASAFTVNPADGSAFASPGGGGCCPQAVSGCLYGVDLTTGAATQLGCDPLQEGLDPFSDFAFAPNGTLYALRLASNAAPNDSNIYLCTIDPANGAIADIGMTSNWCLGNALAFVGNALYTWDDCIGLSTVSLTTGATTNVGLGTMSGFPVALGDPRIPAMATAADGTLYGVVNSGTDPAVNAYLATIDRTNGDVTYVATLTTDIQGISFASDLMADLAIVKNAMRKTTKSGGQFVYSIVATNHGPDPAEDVVIVDTVPAGATFSSSSVPCSLSGSTLTCSWGDLPPGGQAALSLGFTVDAGGKTTLTNAVTVTSGTLDPDTSNNSSSVTSKVVGKP